MTGGGLTLTRITIAILFFLILYLFARMSMLKANLIGERHKKDHLKKENKLLKEIIMKFKEGVYTGEKLIEEFQSMVNKDKSKLSDRGYEQKGKEY